MNYRIYYREPDAGLVPGFSLEYVGVSEDIDDAQIIARLDAQKRGRLLMHYIWRQEGALFK